MSAKDRSAAPMEIDWIVEARHNAGAGPKTIAAALEISRSAVVGRIAKMKRYREGERMLAEDPESIEGLKRIGVLPWSPAAALQYRYVERLSQLSDWSGIELLCCPNVGVKAIETIKALMAAQGLELHPDRTKAVERRTKFDDWYEQRHRTTMRDDATYVPDDEVPAEPRIGMADYRRAPAAPVIGRAGNVVRVDFRRPPVE